MDNIEIPITIRSDENGYFDRECPNEDCLYQFKIKMSDWEEKVSDDEVHCPMCGHVDISDKWWTQEQLDPIKEIATSYALNMIQKELDKSFKQLERSTRRNKFFKITYKPGRRISFINNPIGQMEEWETEQECPQCGTHYSVIGTAFFCPCCGHDNVKTAMLDSLNSIEKMILSLDEIEQSLVLTVGKDMAKDMTRNMLEGSLGDIVSAFQKYADVTYTNISGKKVRVNDFQIVEKGSELFKDACGFGYDAWISEIELAKMNQLFQKRHLLEHNGGIVDQKYIDKSGDFSYKVGQRIVTHKSDAIELLDIIKKLCSKMQKIK